MLYCLWVVICVNVPFSSSSSNLWVWALVVPNLIFRDGWTLFPCIIIVLVLFHVTKFYFGVSMLDALALHFSSIIFWHAILECVSATMSCKCYNYNAKSFSYTFVPIMSWAEPWGIIIGSIKSGIQVCLWEINSMKWDQNYNDAKKVLGKFWSSRMYHLSKGC